MGRTTRKAETIYIDHEKLRLMAELSRTSGFARAVLWRIALDDLLIKYGVLKRTPEDT